MADRVMLRRRPSSEILSGESADVYFARAEELRRRGGLDPMVPMEVFARQEAVLCGIDEAKILIAHALEKADPDEVSVEGLDDGDTIASKEIVLPIRAGPAPTGTMPHSLVLIFGDTVKAAEAFDRDLGPEVPRIVLVDTFKDEAEEALRVAQALGDRLYGIRLDTPSERGRVTADLVTEVRARLDQ